MGRPRNENPHLAMTGVVNADKWQQMDEDTRKAWVLTHANEVLGKLVHMDPMKEPSAEVSKVYDVSVWYTLLDCSYTQCGEVLYQLEWSKKDGAKFINLK